MISASAQDVKVMKLNKRDSTAGVTVTLFNVRFGWPEMVRRTSQWSWMISHRIVARLKENTSFFAFSCTVFRLLWAAFPFRKMTPKSSQTAQSPALAMVMFLCLCRDLDSLGAFFLKKNALHPSLSHSSSGASTDRGRANARCQSLDFERAR